MKTRLTMITCLLFSTALFAQSETDMISFSNPFVSVPALTVFITLLTEFLKKKINLRDLGLQIFTWGIGLVLAVIGKLLVLGVFGAMEWNAIITTGVMIGVGSNILFKNGISKPTKNKLDESGKNF